MLLRDEGQGVLAIGQASHAWLSGQLARGWGNARFGALDPREAVCLAAEQHDVGMAAWDLSPTRNPQTGLPHAFTEMPIATHLKLWRAAPRRLITQSPYAALLVSMHGRRLYERRDLTRLTRGEVRAVRQFLADAVAFHDTLTAQLSRAETDQRRIARNSDLIWTWDFLSLALCLDWAPCTAHAVPTADGATDITVERSEGGATLRPWPFDADRLRVGCAARRLSGPYDTDDALADALDSASWETVEFALKPGT